MDILALMRNHFTNALSFALGFSPALALCETINVSSSTELHAAITAAGPGTTILIASGVYTGGWSIHQKSGAPDEPIIIAPQNPSDRPIFEGGRQALHLSDCDHVTLRGLHIRDFTVNGINLDDGATYEMPSRHIIVEDMLFERIGPTGNVDALKMSGVDDFEIRNCIFRGWGGSAIDMVGCHRGLIEHCTFTRLDGHDHHSGIQMKGGTTDIRVLRSTFINAAQRAINLGGSTGLEFFRPKPEGYEAARIEIAGNRFIGGDTAIAFVTARDSHVHHNTIHRPKRWAFRILQETTSPDFAPCSNARIEHNLIVFDSNLSTTINIGQGTAPETFTFHNNAWYGEGVPSAPKLPTPETDAIIGINPNLLNEGTAELKIGSDNPQLAGIGADGFLVE